MRKLFAGLLLLQCAVVLMNCGKNKSEAPQTTFTKVDSLTDNYLAFQDSILQSWNIMMNDDNQKINAMHKLLHELLMTNSSDRELLRKYEGQLDQLSGMRYTQKSMANAEVVEEYDFASSTLVSELLSLAESKVEFAANKTLQKLVDDIRMADQRVDNYREEYDSIVGKYNRFLEKNEGSLMDIGRGDSIQKKYLFQTVSVQ